jgi:hypothetical protein
MPWRASTGKFLSTGFFCREVMFITENTKISENVINELTAIGIAE